MYSLPVDVAVFNNMACWTGMLSLTYGIRASRGCRSGCGTALLVAAKHCTKQQERAVQTLGLAGPNALHVLQCHRAARFVLSCAVPVINKQDRPCGKCFCRAAHTTQLEGSCHYKHARLIMTLTRPHGDHHTSRTVLRHSPAACTKWVSHDVVTKMHQPEGDTIAKCAFSEWYSLSSHGGKNTYHKTVQLHMCWHQQLLCNLRWHGTIGIFILQWPLLNLWRVRRAPSSPLTYHTHFSLLCLLLLLYLDHHAGGLHALNAYLLTHHTHETM